MSKQYAAINGELPKKRDMPDWGEVKIMQFLKFLEYWTVDGKFKVTKDSIANMELRAPEEPFWLEFMVRINMRMDRADFTPRKFYYRLMNFARIPLSWLKQNPHAVTPDMLALMEKNNHAKWAMSAFTTVKTKMGADVVVLNQDETTDPNAKNRMPKVSDVKSPAELYHQALFTIGTVANQLLKGISMADIKKMSAKERIALANNILPSLGRVLSASKSNVVIFQQINANKAGRDELEKKIHEYVETQEA